MKKLIALILIISPLLFSAQNTKKEKVKTSFLSYPKIDMTKIDVATLEADYCVGDVKLVTQNLKKGSNVCKAKGGKAQALEIFYYQVGVMNPVSYLRIKDKDGNLKYVTKLTDNTAGSADFGKDKCYWTEGILKSTYAKEKGSFNTQVQKDLEKEVLKKATESLNSALFFTYVEETVEIHYVKDKNGLYDDLERASTIAQEGYESISNNAEDSESKSKLKQAIAIWEKALLESNPESKDARIDKKVTLLVAENIANAYFYLREFDKAADAVNQALDLEQRVSTPATDRRKELLDNIAYYKYGYEKNKATPIDLSTAKIMITQQPKSEMSKFSSDADAFGIETDQNKVKENIETYNEAVEAGEVNKYQRFVLDGAAGKQITLPDLASKMMKDPAGDKLDEFPEELTELTELNIIILRGNNIKSIPPSISKLINLKKLVLVNNVIRSLPPEIAELKELKTLNLKGNPIQPDEQAKIQSLLPDCKINF